MPSLGELISHWGYLAIFVVVIFGNVGIPVPEEGILLLAGYLVWEGKLRALLVMATGIVSAVAGDNIGYWLGRRFGRQAIMRYGRRLFITSKQFDAGQRFVARGGALAVFLARFLPGLRFLAGPFAGILGLPFRTFFLANLLGATTYVPIAVSAGYAVGYGFGDSLQKLEQTIGKVEHFILIAAFFLTALLMIWRVIRARSWTRSL